MGTILKPLQGVRKIAILRANALGDFIFALPAIRALRAAYPDAELVYLGKQWHADFIPGRVLEVDRVVTVPPYKGVSEEEDFVPTDKDNRNIAAFFETMHNEHFDVALQLHGGGRNSNPFVQHLWATVTVGSATDDALQLDRTVPYRYFHSEVLRYLEVVGQVGAVTDDLKPRLTVTPDDAREAAEVRLRAGVLKPYIVVHPGASDRRRRWSTRKFAAVANRFLNHGYDVAVTGILCERELVERVVAGTHGRAAAFCGSLTLGGLAALLAEAEIVVSNDTGPLHLAEAVNTPTVGVYWVGNIILATPMTCDRHITELSWTLACRRCGTSILSEAFRSVGGCQHQISFVDEVPISTIIRDCTQLLRTGMVRA